MKRQRWEATAAPSAVLGAALFRHRVATRRPSLASPAAPHPPPTLPVRLAPLLLLLLAAGCQPDAPRSRERASTPFSAEGTLTVARADGTPLDTLAVEFADTDSTIQRGLMQREGLPDRSGMLFLMPTTKRQAFYMANTRFSLDILFFGEDSSFVSAATYTTPYSTESLPSEGPARYVLEVPAGYVDRHGLLPGDRIRWTRDR